MLTLHPMYRLKAFLTARTGFLILPTCLLFSLFFAGNLRADITCYDSGITLNIDSSCYDAFTDTTFSTDSTHDDCPPQQLLDQVGSDRKQRSELLTQWRNLDRSVKTDYRCLQECSKQLRAFELQLQTVSPSLEEQYNKAVLDLRRLLLSYFARLAIQTGVIAADISSDAHLMINQIKSQAEKTILELRAGRIQGEMLAEFEKLTKRAAALKEVEQFYGVQFDRAISAVNAARRAALTEASGRYFEEFDVPEGAWGMKRIDPRLARQDVQRGVRMFTNAERAEARLYAITEANGNVKLVNNKLGTLDGEYLYVMDAKGNIFITKEGNLIQHSSLAGGKPVAGAGHIKFDKGTVEWWNDHSGHYTPEPIYTQQVKMELESRGVKMPNPIFTKRP